MELFEARDDFIIQKGEHALWCNRFDGTLSAKRGKAAFIYVIHSKSHLTVCFDSWQLAKNNCYLARLGAKAYALEIVLMPQSLVIVLPSNAIAVKVLFRLKLDFQY